MTKQGSPWLRWILVQCAMTAVRYDKHFKIFYERLKIRKGHGKAIVATAKEMLVIIWYVLTRRELYRYMNRQRYEQKLFDKVLTETVSIVKKTVSFTTDKR